MTIRQYVCMTVYLHVVLLYDGMTVCSMTVQRCVNMCTRVQTPPPRAGSQDAIRLYIVYNYILGNRSHARCAREFYIIFSLTLLYLYILIYHTLTSHY